MPISPATATRAQALLEQLAGPDAVLRPDQAEAIGTLVDDRRRCLVVQRTGFGKSAIYFVATKLRRDDGAGPTLVVSPLLALMRDQVAAAERMGVRSATINSTNLDDWGEIEAAIARDEVDLLAISPERLNNPGFVQRVLPALAARVGMLVVDEAHCISDWGHDFRPDYRRIRDAIADLAPDTPVVATTATANARVCADVAGQLGDDVVTLRGPLDRESLQLGVTALDDTAARLAWLAQRIPEVPGTGIVYCLTVAATAQVAEFLAGQGIDAHAYSSDTPTDERASLEERFKDNRLKVLVATSALGMGVDKPDVAFVYHLGAPPSPIAYYQQVGRAGRSIDAAEAWLLPGREDRAIWDWFASVGLPPEPLVRRVLAALSKKPTSLPALETAVDLRRGRLEVLLKILDVDGAATRVEGGWIATGEPWAYDQARIDGIAAARVAEADAMEAYAAGDVCLMRFLREALDDPEATDCGRCARCTGAADPVVLDSAVVEAARTHLRTAEVPIDERKQWARGLDEPRGNIAADRRAERGRALCRVGDDGWWPVVRDLLAADGSRAGDVADDHLAADGSRAGDVADDHLAADDPRLDEVMTGIVAALKRWRWERRPTAVTWIPSRRHDALLAELAARIGRIGTLEVVPRLVRVDKRRPQDEVANSAHKLANVWGALAVDGVDDEGVLPRGTLPDGPVLVLDDVYDSGWTMTVVAALLRDAGADAVLPFPLARR